MLKIKDLRVNVGSLEILKGINLEIKPGEVHALMGPNGSGKTTLSLAVMGHPKYTVDGSIKFSGKEIKDLPTEQRARKGIFLAFQNPNEIAGVSIREFLKTAYDNSNENMPVFRMNKKIDEELKKLKTNEEFANRYLNHDFSGGEKKKSEVLQLSILRPKIAILDELDSGLDIDALKTLAKHVRKLVDDGLGILIITHYARILEHLKPDYVHVIADGKIVKSGNSTLANELEKTGYGVINGS